MAKSHGRLLYFAVTPPGSSLVDLSSQTEEVNGLPGDIDLGDITTAGSVGHVSYPGLQKVKVTSKHLYDDAASTGCFTVLGGFQATQQSTPTTYWLLTYGPRGSTAGYPKITVSALVSSLTLDSKVTDPLKFSVSWEGCSGVTIGTF